MNKTFNDNHTEWLNTKMTEYEDRIYEMEDDMSSFDENETAIINYLNDIHFSMPVGLALRRYLCTKYARFDSQNKMYIFDFNDEKFVVTDYQNENYDITVDELSEYSEIFMKIDILYNSVDGKTSSTGLVKAEVRRMLKLDTTCTRNKLFLISFALHMNADEVHKFLTDILAEQTYNFRNPNEIIAFFCQTHDEYNSFLAYEQIKENYKKLSENNGIIQEQSKSDYTEFANIKLKEEINSVDDLTDFLLSNQSEFDKCSQTAYKEYVQMYFTALEKTKIQPLSNDDYVAFSRTNTLEQAKTVTDRINKAIGLEQAKNAEQLAKEILSFVPRYTKEYDRKLKKEDKYVHVVENDFINIYNGERGQKSSKIQTTTLPKEITKNLLVRDRMDALLNQKKPVQRKDLVFMKFYLFSLDMAKKEEFTTKDYWIFIDECNDMLLRCGFSRLYPGNRFENLILLSLLSSKPYEMFENILEYSFFNEPEFDNEN